MLTEHGEEYQQQQCEEILGASFSIRKRCSHGLQFVFSVIAK